jgi:methylase of polypeptide subunit release factors
MATIIRRNERSWAIELITKINLIAESNDLVIKKAGGESTISTGRGNTMFPDVVLYGNKEQSIILQGWELKMPDVPIENETFIKDAQRKAVALNLNSCLIWNFTYAVLYVRGKGDTFSKLKQWSATNYIHTREDVKTYQADWEKQLEEIITEVNGYFVSGQFRNAPLGQVISESTITTLINRNKDIIAEHLKAYAFRNTVMAAYVINWWLGVKTEYAQDETDEYKAYAKSIILNWANRIIFAHIIKDKQNGAMIIDEIDYDKTPEYANTIFKRITSKCDFYNVFADIRYNEVLPELSWQDFVEFSNFLRSNNIDHLDQKALQNILEGSVATSKRAINGQYTTPPELAKLLVRLTVRDWSDTVLDCCCGTGTIPKEAIQIKKARMTAKEAVETVWACDKNNYPLQVANISMTDSDTINIANRLFQHNALTLSVGEEILITNPETGDKMSLSLPTFGAVVSNLPFVAFEIIPDDDRNEIAKMPLAECLGGRSDLYCYIATKIADVIKPGGMLGIIVSNSWLGTNAGLEFVDALKQKYNIRQVHISSKGRWFKNADVVTTIIVLEKRQNGDRPATEFWLWKKSLEQLAEDVDAENTLVNSALLSTELNRNISKLSQYTQKQIDDILSLDVCYNALFHDVDWLLDAKEKIIPINQVYHVFRGSRRGWDALFYPKRGEHHIEPQYLKKVLINAKNVTRLIATADRDAFCCSSSLEELQQKGHFGALEWIEKFADQRNNVGKPLPIVLRKKGIEWYELQSNEIAEVFTGMNPDQRFFFAKFDTPSFVNQRLIGLTHKEAYPDEELNHALLNSMLTMFYIEASGFGRGLGVLDINKDKIAKCYMLNPKLISRENRDKIVKAFEKLKARPIMRVADELSDETRIAFEHTVLKSFGLDNYFDKITSSLLSMIETRTTVKE